MRRAGRPALADAARRRVGRAIALLALASAAGPRARAASAAAGYDPLALAPGSEPRHRDDVVRDGMRARDIPIRVYLPAAGARAPVVLFSHGLGGSRAGSAFLGRHWAARGYLAVFVQHPGSDESLWRDAPVGERMAALARGASLAALRDRLADVRVVLDALVRRNGEPGDWLQGRVDPDRVGMFCIAGRLLDMRPVSAPTVWRPGCSTSRPDQGWR